MYGCPPIQADLVCRESLGSWSKHSNSRRQIMLGRDKRQRRRRIAAVGAAGVAAKKHHDKKVAGEEEAGPPETAPPASSSPPSDGMSEDSIKRLKELGELHDQNILSDAEFESEKAKLLD
jgi:hypothetical protein